MDQEIWKDVVGYEGYYQVSDMGRVRSLPRIVKSRNRWGEVSLRWPGKLLTLLSIRGGYKKVLLSKDGKVANKVVSSLVMEAFIGPRPKGLFVLHGDGDPENNRVSNLRYGTQKENMMDSILHGTRPKGVLCTGAKLTPAQVSEIRTSQETNAALARRFGVDTSTVRLARTGRNWRHL